MWTSRRKLKGRKRSTAIAVKARPVRVVVSHDRADEDLQQQDPGDDEKVFADPPLARGQRGEPCQHRVHRRLVRIVQIALIDEQHGAEGEEREAEADPGPPEGAGGRRIADQRLERPVLGPGPSNVPAAARRSSATNRSGSPRSVRHSADRDCRPGSSPWRNRDAAGTGRSRPAASGSRRQGIRECPRLALVRSTP